MKVTNTTTIILDESDIKTLICDKLREDGYEITGSTIEYNLEPVLPSSPTVRFNGCTITILNN